MKEYKDRTYRRRFCNKRWRGFIAEYKETDVWVGVDNRSYHTQMPEVAVDIIRALRDEMDAYIRQDPYYTVALVPYDGLENAPKIAKEMSAVSHKAGVGPMAAVAGAFAAYVAIELKKRFPIKEIIVENGGDIYADIQEDMDVAIFAGESPLSNKIGLCIKASESPMGICTSSGTVGPSLSFGKADAVMIICKDAMLADAFATTFANRIQTSEDINPVIEQINCEPEILSALLVKDDRMAITGAFEMKLFHIR